MEKLKLAEVRELFNNTDVKLLPDLLKVYADDKREGVIKIVDKYQTIYDRYLQELIRLEKISEYENNYRGCEYIAGIDEAGRGPLAGPVVTCALILPKGEKILYINDSKKLNAKRREELYEQIMEKALSIGIGSVDADVIDDINILQATYEAMRISISNLKYKPDVILNDAVTIPGVDIEQVPIIKGDAKSITIAAASIIAKVTRDRMMEEYDKLYPEYDFINNKGYGSLKHIEAIKKYGLCPIHRKSFVKGFIDLDTL